MDRREILNELAQIVALTDFLSERQREVLPSVPEAAQRAKGLIRVVESWPIAFPPAPFLSCECAGRLHSSCVNWACKCACHCPPEAPQQPVEASAKHQPDNTHRVISPCRCSCGFTFNDAHPEAPEAPQQPAEPAPAAARHIDTPDELLELLAGVSSDPQIEGLSLAQKASTMALLYAAKALQVIANVRDQTEDWEKWAVRNPDFARSFAARLLGAANSQQPPAPAAQSPTSPQEPS